MKTLGNHSSSFVFAALVAGQLVSLDALAFELHGDLSSFFNQSIVITASVPETLSPRDSPGLESVSSSDESSKSGELSPPPMGSPFHKRSRTGVGADTSYAVPKSQLTMHLGTTADMDLVKAEILSAPNEHYRYINPSQDYDKVGYRIHGPGTTDALPLKDAVAIQAETDLKATEAFLKLRAKDPSIAHPERLAWVIRDQAGNPVGMLRIRNHFEPSDLRIQGIEVGIVIFHSARNKGYAQAITQHFTEALSQHYSGRVFWEHHEEHIASAKIAGRSGFEPVKREGQKVVRELVRPPLSPPFQAPTHKEAAMTTGHGKSRSTESTGSRQ